MDLEKDSKLLEQRTILVAPTGSYAYGTAIEGQSDHDYKGIVSPPVSYFMGLDTFKGYDTSGGKNFKNTKDDVDYAVIHINKFVNDAMKGVPNNIEVLFLDPDKYVKLTGLGEMLLENRHLFLSKQLKKKFAGYAKSQMEKMKRNNSNGQGRVDLIEKYGYNTKFFMHTVRLQTSAIEILMTHDFSTFRPNWQFLLNCRNGHYTFEEALKMIELYDSQMNLAYEKSSLPEFPDEDKINRLLIDINTKALKLWGEI